jgi:DMSO/TMAO reductase YedYZ heme-binding membrane subunit
MMGLLSYIRRLVFVFSFAVAVAILLIVRTTIESPDLQLIRLTEMFAFTAVIYLYISLLASPLYAVFPKAPLRVLYVKARKAIGVSAFFFALIHGSLAFNGLLGGFAGLLYLPTKYLIAISLSAIALFILSVMALTSLRYFIVRLGPWWKPLHRFVYVAGVLIIVHTLLIGPHFQDFSKPTAQISFTLLFILLALEAIRFSRYFISKFRAPPPPPNT